MSLKKVKGVLNGDQALELYSIAKENNFAIPGVNVTSSSTINAAMETAAKINAPIMIQLSTGGAQFFAGKSIPNKQFEAAIAGAASAAQHVHMLAELYGVAVLLHTDHAPKKALPWIDGLLEKSKEYVERTGKALYTSHMLDLSEEPLEENIDTCSRYFKTLKELNILIEIELGVTGGEEDGIDNTHVDSSKLYTQPEEVCYAYEHLSKIWEGFTIAAAFGNVHGVYKPGNVKLEPKILKHSQEFLRNKLGIKYEKPISYVFHGGSGSSKEEIMEAIGYGVVKMNIDTDQQWAYWDGVHRYYLNHKGHLQQQIGTPDDDTFPNKKFYDPRVWLREAEKYFVSRLEQAYSDLNALNINTLL